MTRWYDELWERQDMLGIDPDPPVDGGLIQSSGYAAWRKEYQKVLDSPEHKAKMARLNATFERIAERMKK